MLAARVQFMTVRLDVAATLADADPPRRVRLDLDGRPRGFGGAFRARIPFDLEALDAMRTRVSYSVELELEGSLAALGTTTVRDVLRRQVGDLLRNVERELAGP